MKNNIKHLGLKPKDGYPTIEQYFQYVGVADLYNAIIGLCKCAVEHDAFTPAGGISELKHSVNVAKTFADTLAANAEILDTWSDK